MTSPLETARALVRQKRGDEAEGFVRTSSPILEQNAPKNANTATNLTKKLGKTSPEATNLTKRRGSGIGEGETQRISYEVRTNPSDPDDLAERAAIVEHETAAPSRWVEGFAVLCSMPTPTGFRPGRWHRIVDAAGVFIDRWAAEAARRGWSDLDVFGCNPDRPDARFDAMGLVLLLDRRKITSIDEHGADLVTNTGARQRFRRRPLPADTIALWQLSG